MVDFAKELLTVNLEDEMRQSYLDYAMSVIVGRALPDVRDGLKPVHRRILYSMSESNNVWNRPYVKCARVIGDVLGKYHPHGDTAAYDALVRMAQDFSMRYMLVDGQGNFGSIDGDSPAAYRYTECRMTKLSSEILADIDKETVDFQPNYDGKEEEPVVLPTRVPTLLVNGSSGIAVGMATNIPPHNIGEVIDATIALIDDADISIEGLTEHLPGPDFPTAATINGAQGIRDAYKTGRGRIYVRAKTHIETNEKNGKESIIVTELPYQVNKARLLEKIAELVKDKKIDGITELRDESDKDGMRMDIELRRGEVSEVTLNNLYKQTSLQNVFGINMVALVDGQPRLLNLKEILECFVGHRREVVTRRTVFELRKARARAHVLEGLAVALANIDEVIELIKGSATPAEAKVGLISRAWKPGVVSELLERSGSDSSRPEGLGEEFGLKKDGYYLSEIQAQAILDLRLHRLTGLEKDKIVDEYRGLIGEIDGFLEILGSPEILMNLIREELFEVREKYQDKRRTIIKETRLDLTLEDLITEEDVVVTLSHAGYAKLQPLSEYHAQKRGGKGKAAAKVKDEDFIEKLFVASTHDTILCFSSAGKVYWLKVYEIPIATRTARGRPIINLLPLEEDEHIQAILPVREFTEGDYIFMATSNGRVKKTALTDFSRPRANGIIALDLREGNSLIAVSVTNGSQEIMLFSSSGKVVRFAEDKVRPMGRTAAGVKGIKLSEEHHVVGAAVVDPDDEDKVLLATENGFGKRTKLTDFPTKNRAGQGVIGIKVSERNGPLVGAAIVQDSDEAMLITTGGTLVRMAVSDISVIGRNTQGVTLIRLTKDEKLIELESIDALDDSDDEDAVVDGDTPPDDSEE